MCVCVCKYRGAPPFLFHAIEPLSNLNRLHKIGFLTEICIQIWFTCPTEQAEPHDAFITVLCDFVLREFCGGRKILSANQPVLLRDNQLSSNVEWNAGEMYSIRSWSSRTGPFSKWFNRKLIQICKIDRLVWKLWQEELARSQDSPFWTGLCFIKGQLQWLGRNPGNFPFEPLNFKYL